MVNVKIKRLEREGRLPSLPRYATEGAAACDLEAFISGYLELDPGVRMAIPTGLSIELPEGYCAFIMARSGLSLKKGLSLANGVGLIDSDYRGEIMVSLRNDSDETVRIDDGMRIAQMLILPVPAVTFIEADTLGETKRGEKGFGSTGFDKKKEEIVI
ncbi:MAG: dUTP diphosphatase [Clostridia bacterium]|nr:dUTP diphosphatase [Clostridia bacterium]MBQ2326757.1 dUTP diphosphatase [Clostridia bacterium]MBQ5812701.1 dUTP diphosphatase [Clostridia bacterium]